MSAAVPEWPRVSAAILAYNRREPLRITLRTLLEELDYPAEALEIVVVDNASTDGTAEMVRSEFPAVRLIENDRNEGAPGFNRAFAAATGEWVVILDDDAWIRGDALKTAVTRAREAAADLVSFYVLSESGEDSSSFSNQVNTGLLSFWGCAAMVSRRALDRLGGYDPYIFLWGNEVEFTARFIDAGFRHLYLPEVKAVHMKMPVDWNYPAHLRNLRHWSYSAAKLLRPRDAAGALANTVLRVLVESLREPEIIRAMPEVLRGARDGLRNRAPVRPSVSRLYRRHFMEFGTPLRWVRGPLARWRGARAGQEPNVDLRRRQERFYAARPHLYPAAGGALRVP